MGLSFRCVLQTTYKNVGREAHIAPGRNRNGCNPHKASRVYKFKYMLKFVLYNDVAHKRGGAIKKPCFFGIVPYIFCALIAIYISPTNINLTSTTKAYNAR